MALPHKEGYTYVYLGTSANTPRWWGYSYQTDIRDIGFFIGTATPYNPYVYPFYDQTKEWAWSYYHAFPDYPLTTPNNLVVMQELAFNTPAIDQTLYYGGELYIDIKSSSISVTYPGDTVEGMYEPLHPNGTPIEFNNSSSNVGGERLYPRWKEETPYDWWNNAVPNQYWDYYPAYHPKQLSFIYLDAYSYGFSFKSTNAYNGMSHITNLSTGEQTSVPFNPEASVLIYQPKLALRFKSRLCCFNKGARIKGKIVFKQVIMELQAGQHDYGYGGFDVSFENGQPEDHSTVDFEFFINEENATSTDVIVKEIDVPMEDNKAVFIDDFYITDVFAP